MLCLHKTNDHLSKFLPKRCHSPFVTKVLKSPFSAFTNKFNWKQENLISSGRISGQIVLFLWSLFGKDAGIPRLTNCDPTDRVRVMYCLESYRMHSVQGWEHLEDTFVKGDFAPTTTMILDADTAVVVLLEPREMSLMLEDTLVSVSNTGDCNRGSNPQQV